jgi:cell volume regulation protein A
MLAGSEGIGGVYFNNPKTAQFIGIVALNFILFSGGLDMDWQSVRHSLWHGITLSTVGVLLTALLAGLFVWAVTDFTLLEGLLLGSIVSSTDSAAVFSILRSKKLALKGNLRPLLELESGSNDPMAYILTIVFTGLVVHPETNPLSIISLFLKQLLLGGIIGLVMGKIGAILINKIRLDYEGLYIVLVIALMFFGFSVTDFFGGNGFLAVYLSAIYLGSHELIHKKTILRSFDSFAWLMQIVLFLTLGLLVFPSQIIPVIGIGLLISLFLMFVARPLSVFISLAPFKVQNRSRWFISWVGLRGAVPIVFATYPLLAGAGKASMIFNIVFFISVTSVLIQGTSLAKVAKWLHLTLPEKVKHRSPSDMELSDSIKSALTEITIPEHCPAAGRQIVELGLPKTTYISFIVRDGKYITPTGSTVIEANDRLFVLSENKDGLDKVLECMEMRNE